MSYGFEFYNDSGNIIFSSLHRPVRLVASGTFAMTAANFGGMYPGAVLSNGGALISGLSSNTGYLIALNIPVGQTFAGDIVFNPYSQVARREYGYQSAPATIGSGQYIINAQGITTASIGYRLYTSTPLTNVENFGIQNFDESGNLLYTFDRNLLRVRQSVSPPTGSSWRIISNPRQAELRSRRFVFNHTADWVLLNFPLWKSFGYDPNWFEEIRHVGIHRRSSTTYVLRYNSNWPSATRSQADIDWFINNQTSSFYSTAPLTLMSVE